jgi:hypothetical protein
MKTLLAILLLLPCLAFAGDYPKYMVIGAQANHADFSGPTGDKQKLKDGFAAKYREDKYGPADEPWGGVERYEDASSNLYLVACTLTMYFAPEPNYDAEGEITDTPYEKMQAWKTALKATLSNPQIKIQFYDSIPEVHAAIASFGLTKVSE